MRADRDTESVSTEAFGDAAPELAVGALVDGRFEIVRLLGRGGFASVYEARDLKLRQRIALKVLHRSRATREQWIRLRREVRIAREIEHPNLVRIFEISTNDSVPYVAMELIEGKSLRDLLDQEGRPDFERALEISRQLFAGLDALHTKGVIHRDVKPGNILVTPEGRLKLVDLGLARAVAGEETDVTASGIAVGTFEYLAPEQVIGRLVDERSDLYSAGLVLYELIAGRRALESHDRAGYVAAHLTQTPKPLHRVAAGTPRWLSRLVGRLLEKHPRDRYGSAREVLRDLDRRSSRLRLSPILAGAVAAVIAGAAVTTFVLWHNSRYERIIEGSGGGIAAVDRSGRVLWEEPRIPAIRFVPFRLRGETLLAGFRSRDASDAHDDRFTLLTIDPQSGEIRRKTEIPYAGGYFPGYADAFVPEKLSVTDLDSDGNDEVVIDYTHTYWPSYSVIWEPLTGKRAFGLIASGHHRFIGARDLNGDGLKELFYAGINNRIGYLRTLCAVEPRRPGETISYGQDADTPDRYWSDSGARRKSLLWYSLLPRDAVSQPEPVVTKSGIVVRLMDGRIVRYGHDGFREGGPNASLARRAGARERAYGLTRSALRAMEAGVPSDALPHLRSALDASRAAAEPLLEEWIRLLTVQSLIRSERYERAGEEIGRLLESSSGDADIYWTAGNEYHLKGLTSTAAALYRKGLLSRVTPTGRSPYELAEAELFAHLETGDYAAAVEAAQLLRAVDPAANIQSDCMTRWIEWIRGDEKAPLPHDQTICEHGVYRYWCIEMQREKWSRARVRRELEDFERSAPRFTPMIESLNAVILYEDGRAFEAVMAAQRSFEQMLERLDSDTAVRGHARLIAERFLKIASAADEPSRADEAGRFLESWGIGGDHPIP